MKACVSDLFVCDLLGYLLREPRAKSHVFFEIVMFSILQGPSILTRKNYLAVFSDFRYFLDFWAENGVSGAWEVVKKVGGGVALRCGGVSWRGEP